MAKLDTAPPAAEHKATDQRKVLGDRSNVQPTKKACGPCSPGAAEESAVATRVEESPTKGVPFASHVKPPVSPKAASAESVAPPAAERKGAASPGTCTIVAIGAIGAICALLFTSVAMVRHCQLNPATQP